MALPNDKKIAADRELASYVGEQVSGDERTHHEREPLGFEDQMPGPVGPVPEEESRLDASHPYGGLPTHEGYDIDPDTHFRRVRNMVVASIVITLFVGVAWVVVVGARIVPGGDPGKMADAVDEARATFDAQFRDISAQLNSLTGSSSTPAASATASLNTALDAMRERLSTATAASATTSVTSTLR